MITLDMTGMSDAEKVKALTAELDKVLDDGTKQWIKHKELYCKYEELKDEYDKLINKYWDLLQKHEAKSI